MTAKERLESHDRQIAALREAIHEGMRLVLETRKDTPALVKAQRELTATLKLGANGHSKAKLDLY